ncbi:MAG: peptidoglycan DD-metalloendopeptidase family protein [Defluviitaleaceae bacterium]|nr:peptidoglycan DD-metalloendopeptidase family protein [Defluviitaleaceae bacterium]MCL2275824.1 peptidoglycan DD-metalloendopeptidase family protein [Defluviitaleaceae bacterium]
MGSFFKKIIVIALVFAVALPAITMHAQVNLQELRNNRADLRRSIANAQNELGQIGRAISEAEREMERIDVEMMRVMDEMIIVLNDLDLVEGRLEQAEIELEAARVYRNVHEKIVHDRLRALHEHGQPTLLDVLVQSTSVRDFMLRMEWMTQISRQDQQMLQRLEEAEVRYIASVEDEARLRNTLIALEDSLTRSSEELSLLMDEWETTHERLLGEQLSFEQLRDAYQARERTIDQQIAAEERRQEAERERQRQRALAALQSEFNGELMWPVPGFFQISSPYGNRPNPFNRARTQFHSGIDIAGRGINGANVLASRDGYVVRAATGWNGGYGTMIIIDHGGGMRTLYAHLSALLVSQGQRVYEGQVIGRVGSTGNSTGPHLHFEVQINGRHTNPMPFLRG